MIFSLELEDLRGEYLLSGIDCFTNSDFMECLFILDGTTYSVKEDLKSSLGVLKKVNKKVNNKFESHEVTIKLIDKDKNEILHFIDNKTDKVILELGTGLKEDYSAYFIMNWKPENLFINNNNLKTS